MTKLKRTAKRQSEATIQHDIRLALGNEDDLVLFRVQPGGISDAFGRPIRTAPNGIADLCGVLAPSGRWFCLEVKTARGRQSKAQKQFEALIRSMGGFYAVVRSVSDACSALDAARAGRATWRPGRLRLAA